MLEDRFGAKLRISPRIFVAHAERDGRAQLHQNLAKHLLMLLTGLDDKSLAQAGDIELRDPVTEQRLWPRPVRPS